MARREKSTDLAGLEAHALAQGGYFDRRDAQAYGVGDQLLRYHTRTGRFERLFPGVCRLRVAPPPPAHDDLLQAWVWSNYRGAISHESALALYGLGDVMPDRVHLTVPKEFGRTVPPDAPFVLHRSTLAEGDVTSYAGLQVTTPTRTIVDSAAAGTGPEQIHKAVRDALRRTLATAEALRTAAARPGYPQRRIVQPLIEAAILAATSHAAA